MCNIAGYVGTKNAAEILIGMIGREEGFDGGYYTGIATLNEGTICCEKLTGALYTLLEKKPAASLKGKIGIIHSRSESGGGDEWAHPFLEGKGETPRLAYIANGGNGCCKKYKARKIETAQRLEEAGYRHLSKIFLDTTKYVHLPDGSVVHMSDVMCQLIMEKIDEGHPVNKAMELAFIEAPSEIVGLSIYREIDDRVFFARYNFPLFAGFAPDGGYLASTPVAFPETVTKVIPIPACSSGYITKDELYCSTFVDRSPFSVEEADARIMKEGYDLVCSLISEKPCSNHELRAAVKPLFSGADTGEPLQLLHSVYASLQKQGKLEISLQMQPGCAEGLLAPEFYMKRKEA